MLMYEIYSLAGEREWCSATGGSLLGFEAYVNQLRNDAAGIGVAPGWVPTSHFWLRLGDELVGTIRIRHYLTPEVEEKAGHIGYDIAPKYRRRGLGHEILRLGLIEAARLGLHEVLAICSKSNVASMRILVRYGGKCECERDGELRFWIRSEKGPNKAPEPTPGAVTPRATEGTSK